MNKPISAKSIAFLFVVVFIIGSAAYLYTNNTKSTVSPPPSGITTISGSGTSSQSTTTVSSGSAPFGFGATVCNSTNQLFTYSPISSTNLTGIVPLGWVSAGGHVLPSDHIYFYITTSPGPQIPPNVTVVSPGNITITQVDYQNYSTGNRDYSLHFSPCSDMSAFFYHLGSVSAKISNAFNQSLIKHCSSNNVNGLGVKDCTAFVSIKITAGEKIGTVGGYNGSAQALDLGLYDDRLTGGTFANASRYRSDELHVACPLDYYTSNQKNYLYSRIGLYGVVRTTSPLCGTIYQDISGTAQGNWFSAGSQQQQNEGMAVSLVHGNLVYNEEVFSTGTQVGISGMSGVTYYFTLQGSGLVNRDFGNVTSNGAIYCYNHLSSFYANPNQNDISGIVLLQLLNANTLRIEKQSASSCGSGQWSFTQSHVDLYR